MIQSENTTLFIEPIKSEDATELNSIHRKHLVYRRIDVMHDDAPVFDRREKAPAIGKVTSFYNLCLWKIL